MTATAYGAGQIVGALLLVTIVAFAIRRSGAQAAPLTPLLVNPIPDAIRVGGSAGIS